jgi:hypothetical protein
MQIGNGFQALNAYGASRDQKESRIARTVQNEDIQMRIAKGSTSKLVLQNLALNENLHEKVVDTLFSRDIPQVSKRLEKLGYEQSLFSKLNPFD